MEDVRQVSPRPSQFTTFLVLGLFLGSIAVGLAPVPTAEAQAPAPIDVLVNPSLEGVAERPNGFDLFFDGAAPGAVARTGTQSANLAAVGPSQTWGALGNLGLMTFDGVRFADLANVSFFYHAPDPLTGPGALRLQSYISLDLDGDGVRDNCVVHLFPDFLAQTPDWTERTMGRDTLAHDGGANCAGGDDVTPIGTLQANPALGAAEVMSVRVQTTLSGAMSWPAGQAVYVDDAAVLAAVGQVGNRVSVSHPDGTVCGGPSVLATISDALHCARSSSTLEIGPGVYEESVNVDVNRLGEELVFVTLCPGLPGLAGCLGAAASTVIDATGLGVPAVSVRADFVDVYDLTLRGDAPVVEVIDVFGAEITRNVIDKPVFQAGTSAAVHLLRADGIRVQHNTIRMSVNVVGFGGTAYGIRALETDIPRIESNTIVGSQHPAETAIYVGPVVGGTDGGYVPIIKENVITDTKTAIRLERQDHVLVSLNEIDRVGIGVDLINTHKPRLSYNTIRGIETESAPDFLEMGVFIRQGTDDWDLEFNHISLFPRGVYVGGSADGGVIRNNVISHNGFEGVRVEGTQATPDVNVTGNLLEHNLEQAIILDTNRVGEFRENRMNGGHFALALTTNPDRFPDLELDARVNGWGIDNWRLIESRIQKLDTQTVDYLPYLDIEEPGFPVVSSHSATAATCAAHPDADWIGNHCRFLTVQAALDFADAGATVYVPMSAHLEDPTPRFESLDIATDGVTVCSSIGGHVCAADAAKGHFEIRENMAFGEPPVLWSGEAISLDTSAEPFHGSTSFFPADGFQLDDVERLTFDWLLESGACGAGSPRMAFWADLDGSGTRAAGETVLAYPDLGACATGEWNTEDLVNEPGAYFTHPSTGTTDLAGAHGALAGLDPAYQIDAVNVQYDTPANVVWLDNVLVNDFVLAEELDLSCVLTGDAACRQDFATAATIIDGSAANEVVSISADDVTLRGLTLRRTGDQAPGSSVIDLLNTRRAAIVGNDIRIEGGGCTADQLVSGDCASDPLTTGISGSSRRTLVEDNTIAANLFSDDTGELGGSYGVVGVHRVATIAGNTFEGWAMGAVAAKAPRVTVASNVFDLNRVGVSTCQAARDMQIQGNQFLVNGIGLELCGPSAAVGLVANENAIGMTNAIGFQVADGILGGSVDAECNDWGVYHNTLIQELRVNDTNVPRNDIDTDPFTGADEAGIGCLLPPVADFTATTFSPLRGELVEFIDQSANGTYLRPIVSWEWDFGDGASAFGPGVAAATPGTGERPPGHVGTIRHAYAEGGLYDVTLRVTDSAGVVDVVTKTISVENAGPRLDVIADRVIAEAESLTVPLYASDADGDDLTLEVFGLPPGATFTPLKYGKGMIQWTPTLTQSGVYPIFVTATDSVGTFDSESFTVTVVDTIPVPGFPDLADTCVLAGYPTTTTVQAEDADGDAITLSASGLPSWASFVDGGNGLGRFHLSPPTAAIGGAFPLTVTASAGGDVTSATFNLCVKGHPDLHLDLLENQFLAGSPGETILVDARVRNTGSTGAVAAFGIESQKGWTMTPPAAAFVPAGSSTVVTFEVVVGSNADRDRPHIWTEAPAYPGEVENRYFVVEVPVGFTVDFEEATSAGGVRGVVHAHYLDGSPAKGVAWTLVQSPDVEVLGLEESSVRATTNAAGSAAFDFGFDATSRVPGLHWFEVSGVRVAKTFAADGAFAVDSA